MSALSRSQKIKGESFLNEAEKTLKKSTWFASSTEQKYEDAAELYEKAANAFKVGHFYSEAGDAYMKAGELHRDKSKNLGEASKALGNAGSCYKKSNPVEAVKAYRSAVTLLCDNGRLTQAAKLCKEIAELYETDSAATGDHVDVNSTNLAIENYEQAAELFGMEDSKSQKSQCLAKVAELSSAQLDPPDLGRAAHIYEDLGRGCLESNLLKYNAKGYFLQAIFCFLAMGDSIAAQQALQRYQSIDFTFSDSREGKFCAALTQCLEEFDTEGFATACFEYDRISKLDPWKTTLLVKVKRSIEEQTDGGIAIGEHAEDGDDVDLT